MSRKKILTKYKVSLEKEEAIQLAKQVFTLQKKLGIPRSQMSAETGLTRSSLSSLKSCWVNSKGKKHQTMFPSIANALVAFWNCHLESSSRQTVSTPSLPESNSAQTVATPSTSTVDLLGALISQVGREEAIKKLAEAGKLEKYAGRLDLTAAELIDLM